MGCTLVVLEIKFLVFKCHMCHVKVRSLCNVVSQCIQELVGAYLKVKHGI